MKKSNFWTTRKPFQIEVKLGYLSSISINFFLNLFSCESQSY